MTTLSPSHVRARRAVAAAGAALLLVATSLLVARPLLRAPLPEPLGDVTPFTLTEASGRAFGTADLAGRPYVVSFFFTSCTTVCPKLMDAAATLLPRFRAAGVDAPLVSVSVDPETDTPERLRAYGDRRGIDGERWRLLTGTRADVRRLIEQGFTTHVGEKSPDGRGGFDIGHGTRLLLIDGRGRIRGHFETTPEGLDALVDLATRLGGE